MPVKPGDMVTWQQTRGRASITRRGIILDRAPGELSGGDGAVGIVFWVTPTAAWPTDEHTYAVRVRTWNTGARAGQWRRAGTMALTCHEMLVVAEHERMLAERRGKIAA
jgi:hypothetical protein